MIDIELSSLPEAIPTQNIPYSQGYFRRFKQGAASLVGEMGRFIPSYLRENGSESSLSPVIISPWERLIDYSSVGYYYTAVSTSMPTTKGLLSYEGAFISNLSVCSLHRKRNSKRKEEKKNTNLAPSRNLYLALTNTGLHRSLFVSIIPEYISIFVAGWFVPFLVNVRISKLTHDLYSHRFLSQFRQLYVRSLTIRVLQ